MRGDLLNGQRTRLIFEIFGGEAAIAYRAGDGMLSRLGHLQNGAGDSRCVLVACCEGFLGDCAMYLNQRPGADENVRQKVRVRVPI